MNLNSQPEEQVRQAVLTYLKETLNCPGHTLIVEKSLQELGFQGHDRVDIAGTGPLKIGSSPQFYLLVECKEPAKKNIQDWIWQTMRYANVLKPNYILITNGLSALYYKRIKGEYLPVNSLPAYSEMIHDKDFMH